MPTPANGSETYKQQITDVVEERINVQYAYETVAASQTAQVMGTTGAVGDFLHAITCTTASSTITVLDDTTSLIVLTPAAIGDTYILDITSQNGAWKITTAAGTACIVSGEFT